MHRTMSRVGAVGAGAVLALGLLVAGPPAGASDGRGAKAGKADNGRVEKPDNEKADNGQVEKAGKPDRADKAGRPDRATCLTTDGHTQGRSQSDPDGMSNGGPDKPGCTGGFDDDRDGNNGCGNDADREDDNNGRCGKGEERDGTTPDRDVSPNVDVDGDDLAGCDVDGKDAEDKDASGCVDTDAEADGVAVAAAGTTDTGTLAIDTSVNGSSTTGTDVAADTAPAGTAATETPTEVLGETLERSPSVLARTGAGVGGLALLGGLLCGGGRIALLARRFLRIG